MDHTDEIKFRGEVLTKPQTQLSLVALSGGIVLSLIFIVLVPTMKEYRSVTTPSCVSEPGCFQLESGNAVWRAHFNNIDVLNQVIGISIHSESSEKLNSDFKFSLSLLGVDSETATEGYEIDTKTTVCKTDCSSNVCCKDSSFYLPIIEYNYYVVKATFLNPIPPQMPSINISFGLIREDFTKYQLAVKYFFLCLSVVSLVVYVLNVRTVLFRKWPLDSKLMAVLSFSLILYNEPFFALKIYEHSEAIFFSSTRCICQFVIVLFGCRSVYNLIYSKDRLNVLYSMIEGNFLIFISSMLLKSHTETDTHNRYDFNPDWQNESVNLGNILMIISLFCISQIKNNQHHSVKRDFKFSLLAIVNCTRMIVLWFPFLLGCFRVELILDSMNNLWVLGYAFYYAPRRVSPTSIQELRILGEEIEDNPEDMISLDSRRRRLNTGRFRTN